MKKNFVLLTIYQIISVLVPFITTPYISKTLKPAGVGLASYVITIANYFVICAQLGTTSVGQRHVAFCQDNKDERNKYFWSVEFLSIATTIASLLAYIIYILFFAKNKMLGFLCIPLIVSVLFDVSWLFMGMEDMSKVVIRNLLIKAVNIICIFLLIKDADDVNKYVLLTSSLNLVSALSMWPLTHKYIYNVRIDLKITKELFFQTLQVFIPVFATSIYQNFDKIMIVKLTGSIVENGYYEQTAKLISMLNVFNIAVGTTMGPRFAYCYKENKSGDLNELLYKGISYCAMISMLLFAGSFGCIKVIQPWFFGQDFLSTVQLVKAYSFRFIATEFSSILSVYLINTMRQSKLIYSQIFALIVNVALNALLIPRIASIGAVVASVIAEYIVAAYILYCLKEDISIRKLIIDNWRYYVAAIVVLHVSTFLGNRLSGGIFHTFFLIGTSTVVYVCVLLMLKDKVLIELINDLSVQ